jgi:hypothetical protein
VENLQLNQKILKGIEDLPHILAVYRPYYLSVLESQQVERHLEDDILKIWV